MRTPVLAALLAALLASGCNSLPRSKEAELEAVAKDWSMTIRASQVIPVYPLTEDLQPGDVFLVQVPVDRQQEIYKQKGFLPLDNLLHRIQPSGYCAFYARSFLSGATPCPPQPVTWLDPGKPTAFANAPGANFPTYTFSARKGSGFNLALPIQGVPVGLSLLGGDAAQGSVTLAEAKTYGVDTLSLHQDLTAWATANAAFLANFAPGEERQNFLRVITRVYLTGNLNVSLQSARSASGGLSAGASKPVDIFGVNPGDKPDTVTADAYKTSLEKLNAMIAKALENPNGAAAGALPGGSLRVVAASANSISLKEDFARPLVIGYLGFDVAIGDDGAIGPPIPTHAVLNKEAVNLAAKARVAAKLTDIDQIVAALTDPASKQLDPGALQTVFEGTAFPDLATSFRGKTPGELRTELSKGKYRSSIAVFKANLGKLAPR